MYARCRRSSSWRAALAAFGVLWVGKFFILNKVLFVHHPEELEEIPALDGRTGLPT